MQQLIKFGLVGILATLIDFLILYLSTDLLGVNYLVSAAIGFIVSTIFNYVASMKYVFKSKYEDNKNKELLIFIGLSIIGLGINELLLMVLVENIGVHYMFGKLLATVVVMLFNFISRKILLEKKDDKGEQRV